MIHDARYQQGKGFLSHASLPPIDHTQATTNSIPMQSYNDASSFSSGKMIGSVRGNPLRKVTPVIGAGTPTAQSGQMNSHMNHNYSLFGNHGRDIEHKTNGVIPSSNMNSQKNMNNMNTMNRDLNIHIDNDNFNDMPYLGGDSQDAMNNMNTAIEGHFKSKRDLMWERKRLQKLQNTPEMNRYQTENPSENLNETTRDRIYRMKREKFLRDQERQMGKRADSSPTGDDLYNFEEKSPKNQAMDTHDNRYNDNTALQEKKYNSNYGVQEIAMQERRLDDRLDSLQQSSNIDNHHTNFTNHTNHTNHSQVQSSRNSDKGNYSHHEKRNVGQNFFDKMESWNNKAKSKFNHDVPQSIFPNVLEDEKRRLIKQNEATGGIFGTLGKNNEQQRYLERKRQASPHHLNAVSFSPSDNFKRSNLQPLQMSPSSPIRGGLFPRSLEEEQMKKRHQQQEYARELQEQMRMKATNARGRRHSDISPYGRRIDSNLDYQVGQHSPIRGVLDSYESRQKALKQQEYKQYLDEQIRLKKTLGNQPTISDGYKSPQGHQLGTPTRRYSSYPSPSHHIDRIPMRHDIPLEEVSKRITSTDTRTMDEKQHAMRQKQEYAQYLKQQMEEKKKREEKEKKLREEFELKHEFGGTIPSELQKKSDPHPDTTSQANYSQPQGNSPSRLYQFASQEPNGSNFDHSSQNHQPHEVKYTSHSPLHPQPSTQGMIDSHFSGDIQSKMTSPTNFVREGVLKYSEPAAVAEKQKKLELQKILKEKLDQQMREKKERELAEKKRIEQEEERERIRFEKELQEQKEKEDLEKKKKALEAEEERLQAEKMRQLAEEEKKRIKAEEEQKLVELESRSVLFPPPTNFSPQSNFTQLHSESNVESDNLFGNSHEPAFSSQDKQNPEIIPSIASSRPRPSRPSVGLIQNDNFHQLNHRIATSEDANLKQKFLELHEKIEQYTQNDDQEALREQIHDLQSKYHALEQLVQKKALLDSRLNTPVTSRRVLNPLDIPHQESFTLEATRPSLTTSPTQKPIRSRSIPKARRSEMMSVNASNAFAQSIQGDSEFLFPTPSMARRSISRARRSRARDPTLESIDSRFDSRLDSRPSTAMTDISVTESDVSTLDTEQLSKKNKYRMTQLEKLETVENEEEKEKLMSQYLKTGKIGSEERPQSTMSLPGASQNIIPTKSSKIPSILDDPFGDSEAPIYKRIGSARSTASTYSHNQTPQAGSIHSSRPSSRRSRRSSIASGISLDSHRSHHGESSRRRRKSVVEQSLSSLSQFLTTPSMDD